MLIVWHSRTGAARQMAHAARDGARHIAQALDAEHRLTVTLKTAGEAQSGDVLAADGLLFCAPENLASVSGQMKEFFDRCYYDVLERINGRPYALMVAAGSDGQGAVRQIERICLGWRLEAIAPPCIVLTHAQTPEAIAAPKKVGPEDRARCAELGGTLAALLL